jgi:hypothetical protein
MPYKDVEKQKYLIYIFYFAGGMLKLSIAVKCMIHNATVLCVCYWPAYWETDTAVVSEQMMQHLFMRNVTREVLHVQGVGTDCNESAMRN